MLDTNDPTERNRTPPVRFTAASRVGAVRSRRSVGPARWRSARGWSQPSRPHQRSGGVGPDALLGVLCAIPAAAVTLNDVPRGLALAIGVLPALIVGVQPAPAPAAGHRGRRRSSAPRSSSARFSPTSRGWPCSASSLAVGAAELASRRPVGRLLMTLGLPLVAVGFSYTDLAEACGLAVVMALGSVYACLVSLAWPERPVGPARPVLRSGVTTGSGSVWRCHRGRGRVRPRLRPRRLGVCGCPARDAAVSRDDPAAQRQPAGGRDRRRRRGDPRQPDEQRRGLRPRHGGRAGGRIGHPPAGGT